MGGIVLPPTSLHVTKWVQTLDIKAFIFVTALRYKPRYILTSLQKGGEKDRKH